MAGENDVNLQPGALRSPLLLLLLLLIALAALITILNRQDRNADAVWTLQTAETVRSIEIRSELPASGEVSEAVTRLTRQGEDWTLSRQMKTEDGGSRDVEVPANADRVAPILGLLQLPRRDNYHVDEIELAELGLAPPQASVEIDNIKFLFGDKTLDGTARYVQVANRIHLYREFLYPLLKAGPDVFLANATTANSAPATTTAPAAAN